jgi:uncharacterized protein YdbL (DUF1318 family)
MHTIIKKAAMVLLALTFSVSAFAINLQDAKKQGLVGEMPNGYLGIVVNSPATTALVKSVNNKRKQLYISLARKNKIALKQVAALAAKKAMNKTAAGNFIKNAQGEWVKK